MHFLIWVHIKGKCKENAITFYLLWWHYLSILSKVLKFNMRLKFDLRLEYPSFLDLGTK